MTNHYCDELTINQKEAIEKLNKLKVGALFMEQGTGKTRTALALIKSTNTDFVLFVTPCSVKSTLQAEINKWGGLDIEYKIVGYETLSQSDATYLEVLGTIKSKKKAFIISDESVFIKNDTSKRHIRLIELAKYSEYRLILNGTPITKNEWDIYNQFEFLSPLIFNMSRDEFLHTFFTHVIYKRKGDRQRDFYKLSEVNVEYLQKLIDPYIYRCNLEFQKEVATHEICICASLEARDRYLNAKHELLNALKYRECSVEMFTNLAISCFDDKERHEAIARHINGQMIVFCTLLSEVQNIKNKIDCYVITGDTKIDDRDKIISQFKKDSKPLLITVGTGAYGKNLQFCNRLAFASLTFDYGKIDQAKKRIKRLGQNRDLEYTYFTSDLGVYKMIKDNINNKKTLSEILIESLSRRPEWVDDI